MSGSQEAGEEAGESVSVVVLDTNIVLDLFLFTDPRAARIREQLNAGKLNWIATAHMRYELERVLTYEHIAAKLAFYQKVPADILAAFDQFAQISLAQPIKAPYTCKDPDDQVFIDLACQLASGDTHHPVRLISKDKAVLCMRKRLEKLSVIVATT